MVVCSAIKIQYINRYGMEDEDIILGLRHSDCFKTIRKHLCPTENVITEYQGFINDKNEFLTREEAYRHFIECGQGTPKFNGGRLYSEDLY